MGDIRRIDEIEGFWVSEETHRMLHIGFENAEKIWIDLSESHGAGLEPFLEAIGDAEEECYRITVLLNLRTGSVEVWDEGSYVHGE